MVESIDPNKPKSAYEEKYEELRCIGRGNFGSAWHVKHRTEGKEYIAKKVVLQGLAEKE